MQSFHNLHAARRGTRQDPPKKDYFIKDTNAVLLKHQKDILNRWKEYFCELLNPVTVQHLKTSEEQFDEEIYLTEAKVSTAIKSLVA